MGSLDSFLVLDCTSGWAGPLCTGALADHGARVIRVESPSSSGVSDPIAYSVYNRGKESLLLDLEASSGRELLERLLATADVVVEDWPSTVADARGLEWGPLHAR